MIFIVKQNLVQFFIVAVIFVCSSISEYYFLELFSSSITSISKFNSQAISYLIISFLVKILCSFSLIVCIQLSVVRVQQTLLIRIWTSDDENRDMLLKRNVEYFCFNYLINYIRIFTEGGILVVLSLSAAVVLGLNLIIKVACLIMLLSILYVPIILFSKKSSKQFKISQKKYYYEISKSATMSENEFTIIQNFVKTFRNIYILMLSQRLVVETLVMLLALLIVFGSQLGYISDEEFLLLISVFAAIGIKFLSSLNILFQSYNSVLTMAGSIEPVEKFLK